MKQMSSSSEWQMLFKIELKQCFWMFKFLDVQVLMDHAADDPPPPFTSQKAALLTTKIAA